MQTLLALFNKYGADLDFSSKGPVFGGMIKGPESFVKSTPPEDSDIFIWFTLPPVPELEKLFFCFP